jgi:integrase
MPSICAILRAVHDTVHTLPMKMFNEPKIYTGGIDVTAWNDLSKKEKQSALNKRWYVYYSFRDPETNNLKRQPNLHLSANRLTTKTERLRKLEYIKLEIQLLLRAGYNPYEENQRFFNVFKSQNTDNKIVDNDKDLIETSLVQDNLRLQPEVDTITDAFEMALEQKKAVMGHSSYIKYRSRINNLKSWLGNIFKLDTDTIDRIGKKDIMVFLNETLIRTSPRNRNNTRTDISSLFQVMEDNEIVKENFVKKIKILKAIPERNKTYTMDQQVSLFKHLRENDPILLLFVKFISYNFLRPIEVCRLKVKDIDVVQKKLYVRAKNKAVKTKIIPEILLKDLKLTNLPADSLLFTPESLGAFWEANEGSRRDHFTKRFKKVKDQFELGSEYGLYSFRHTFITKLYHEFAATMTPSETKGKLMLITGHATIKALEAYLRDLDAVMPEDYSEFL